MRVELIVLNQNIDEIINFAITDIRMLKEKETEQASELLLVFHP
jgi:hypothetical protein